MKLLTVLLLAALPLCCSAGSGCQLLEDVINKTINPAVSMPEYKSVLYEFTNGETDNEAVEEFKECFLNQSNETLENIGILMQIIYGSKFCQQY
ncbi:mammaglobin-A [Otolemur garnettii]|uniref:mammaglobin-A n=1 Tax=Otolemur garnettii TaxID=30611 RepID=UPI0002741FBC|nr:mammaglobin-A [Otolemur garnettii]